VKALAPSARAASAAVPLAWILTRLKSYPKRVCIVARTVGSSAWPSGIDPRAGSRPLHRACRASRGRPGSGCGVTARTWCTSNASSRRPVTATSPTPGVLSVGPVAIVVIRVTRAHLLIC